MKRWLQRIRGALGMGLTWAAAWFGFGTILGLVIGLISGGPFQLAPLIANAVLFGVSGFVGGVAFSGVLGIAEGCRTFDEMSLPRFAGWGAVGGLLLSMLLLSNGGPLTLARVVTVGVVTLMGAGSAAGSLALARRAEDGGLLRAGESAGLIEGE